MILHHPLPKNNDVNKKAIEKYKDRLVIVFHGVYNKFLTKTQEGAHNSWSTKTNAEQITFKQALKRTKHYKKESLIEYHFISSIGEEVPNIKDFEQEEVYNCPSVEFNEYNRKDRKPNFD